MKKLFNKAIAAVMLVSASLSANAALIVNGSTEVNALQLSESFESFYDFNNWSANTGFEQANELVAFFATNDADELGLYMIFSGPTGSAGAINFDINGSNGSVIFVDDPDGRDPVVSTATGSNVTFSYVAGKTDGLVYADFVGDLWSLDILFNRFTGINGYSFLTFDSAGNSSAAVSGTGLDNLTLTSFPSSSVSVSTPSTLMIFALSVVCLLASRRKF